MIVLSRRRHESVMIGDDITILVVETRVDSVRLAINAPKSAPVLAREMYETMRSTLLRKDEEKPAHTPSMTIGQRLRSAIEESGQSLDRLAMQIKLPQGMLEDFVRRNEDLPLSVVQRIASHFRLQLTSDPH